MKSTTKEDLKEVILSIIVFAVIIITLIWAQDNYLEALKKEANSCLNSGGQYICAAKACTCVRPSK